MATPQQQESGVAPGSVLNAEARSAPTMPTMPTANDAAARTADDASARAAALVQSIRREKLLELKEHEREETGSSFAEVRAMRAELEALRLERTEALTRDPRKVASLRLKIREYHVQCEQLEHERSNFMRRATNAEEQLETLSATLGQNLARYQTEIKRLRAAQRSGASRACVQRH